ncbi:hypothetical protein KU75_03330 [Pectobacterium odoriferum]|uniref:DegT/DnrJ/EryC1/StrS aminotransferase family protein n=1 Tax=Pectobacterium odoriferum TaxID=78398 RepID=A0ABR4VU34_9GAMM|nr:hypothetical protein KU75_03330 [Pectobacterium odoriferum]
MGYNLNDHFWIVTDDLFMRPSYRISPFDTSCIYKNSIIPKECKCDQFFRRKHPDYELNYVLKARDGIYQSLTDVALQSSDIVTILSTTQNLYISSCVTNAVERVCQWNREILPETKAIIVVHEFGTVYKDMDSIYSLGVPVIEDFAHSFNSTSAYSGKGDYIIYSFPKYFPIQYGGVVLSKNKIKENNNLSCERYNYIRHVLSQHIDNIDSYKIRRIENYNYLKGNLEKLNFFERLSFKEYETPAVFMFSVSEHIHLHALKEYMQNHGVESSVFYGENAFFIPVHHRLNRIDLDYFIFILESFINKNQRV